MDNSYGFKIWKYVTGFVLSIVITLIAYLLVINKVASTDAMLLGLLGTLAIGQMVVQLVFFLHLEDEVKPRLKLIAFICMTGVLVIVVVGTLWIMNNLNYNMMRMTPAQKDARMIMEKDKGF